MGLVDTQISLRLVAQSITETVFVTVLPYYVGEFLEETVMTTKEVNDVANYVFETMHPNVTYLASSVPMYLEHKLFYHCLVPSFLFASFSAILLLSNIIKGKKEPIPKMLQVSLNAFTVFSFALIGMITSKHSINDREVKFFNSVMNDIEYATKSLFLLTSIVNLGKKIFTEENGMIEQPGQPAPFFREDLL